MTEHVPIIPNLGEHANDMNKYRDNTGKIDADAKTVVSHIDVPKMKHKPTQEEQSCRPSKHFFDNMSIIVVILAFIIILLILAIVWLVLKYNTVLQESDDKERKLKRQLDEKDAKFKKFITELQQAECQFEAQKETKQQEKCQESLKQEQKNIADISSPKASTQANQTSPANQTPTKAPSKEELESTLSQID